MDQSAHTNRSDRSRSDPLDAFLNQHIPTINPSPFNTSDNAPHLGHSARHRPYNSSNGVGIQSTERAHVAELLAHREQLRNTRLRRLHSDMDAAPQTDSVLRAPPESREASATTFHSGSPDNANPDEWMRWLRNASRVPGSASGGQLGVGLASSQQQGQQQDLARLQMMHGMKSVRTDDMSRKRRLTSSADSVRRRPSVPSPSSSGPSRTPVFSGRPLAPSAAAAVEQGGHGTQSGDPRNSRGSNLEFQGTSMSDLDAQIGAMNSTALQTTRQPTSGTWERSRQPSDIVLPRWQPDYEVSECFVCGTPFSFFYRKHHCRKCGRVVCANCSPHRITIPRQFIVRPPVLDLNGNPMPDLYPAGLASNPALGGGEVVRVCNPCVPDPNFSPPPQQQYPNPQLSQFPAFPGSSQPPFSYTSESHPTSTGQSSGQPTLHRTSHSDVTSSSRSAAQDSSSLAELAESLFRHTHPTLTSRTMPASSGASGSSRHRISADVGHSPYAYRPLSTGATVSIPGSTFSPFVGPSHRASQLTPDPVSQQPRRHIREEDECPVCGNELPSKGPNGEESAREQHIEHCIKEHEASFGNAHGTPSSSRTTRAASVPGTASSNSTFVTPTPAPVVVPEPARHITTIPDTAVASSSRPRRHTGNRMLIYKATEKDCTGEDGEWQECVICFEEFEPGDEMARLECLCKFHLTCIRQWHEKKGTGSCPTHQLHE